MRMPDLLRRFNQLVALQNDPKLINLSGEINPYRELAAEFFEIPPSQVSFEQQNYMIRTLQLEVAAAERIDALTKKFGSMS